MKRALLLSLLAVSLLGACGKGTKGTQIQRAGDTNERTDALGETIGAERPIGQR